MSKLALTPAKTKIFEPDLLLLPKLGHGTSQAKFHLLMTFVRPPPTTISPYSAVKLLKVISLISF